MSKAKIIDKKSVDSILGEKNLLSELHHPFIVNMIYSFQDHEYLYLVMDLLPGGNLRYHLSIKNRFNEKQIKFLIGCIMIGLKYIHGQNILHRDIKPENLVFDNNGYLRITDFGIAKHYVVNNRKDTSGTIGYLAPEVLCNVNHNFSIDYYAVGIITYELMYGHRPYLGKTKHEVKQLILTRQAEIDYEDLPYGFSNETADFINRLIQRKPKNRLGKDSINEVIDHPWFYDFDWQNVENKKLKAPYVPKLGDNFDKKYCLQINKLGTDTMERYKKIMMEENYNLIFEQFNCKKIPKELKGYSTKKINEKLYEINNNITSNISTTSISRNNKNENNQSNLIGNAQLIKKKLYKKKEKNDDKYNEEYKDFDKEIFKQIASLNKSLQNLAVLNKKNNNHFQNHQNDLNKNNNNDNIPNKTKNIGDILYNKSSINILRNRDNNLNHYSRTNKTYRNENNNDNDIKKRIAKENINNKFLELSSKIKQINNQDNDLDISRIRKHSKHNNNHNNNYNLNEFVNDNIIFNEKDILENIFNKKKERHLNHNASMGNINNKSKNIINNILIEDQNSMISLNSGILKNMKHQFQELIPNKRNKFLNYTIRDISKIRKNSKEINNNNNLNNNNNINNLNSEIHYKKIKNNIIQSNNNSFLKKNKNMSMPKYKKDFIKKEILKNATFYNPNNNKNQNNSNLNINNINKKSSSLVMSSTIYSKKKTNSSGNSIINNSKRLSSSHSMQNLKSNNEIMDVGGISNFTINNKKSNFINSDKIIKNVSIIDKKLPFINAALNKKKNSSISSEIYYASYGKFNNENDIKSKLNESGNLHYDFFTDRIRNKRVVNNNSSKISYNNKSVNNFLDDYRKISKY